MSSDLSAVRLRLQNWGAWSADRRKLSTARSAEGRYRALRLSEEEELGRRSPRVPVDVLDALIVWEALQPRAPMTVPLALVLHGVFVHRLQGEQLRAWLRRRRVVVRGRDLRNLVAEAERSAGVCLLKVDGRRRACYTGTSFAGNRPLSARLQRASAS